MTIKTSTGSSKTELSSRGKRPFKVRRSGANYGPCPSARKRPALITDPQKFGPTLNIGPAVIMDFKVGVRLQISFIQPPRKLDFIFVDVDAEISPGGALGTTQCWRQVL